jgi:YHS domain-containing protein
MLVKIIVIALLSYLGWRVWRTVSTEPASPGPNGPVRRLVRDPYCHTYIPEGSAERVKHGGVVLYFCSTACREAYFKKRQGDHA